MTLNYDVMTLTYDVMNLTLNYDVITIELDHELERLRIKWFWAKKSILYILLI